VHGVTRAGVIGVGTMGQGIAQVLAQAGVAVCLYDRDPAAVVRAVEAIGRALAQAVLKGRLSDAEREACLQRLSSAAQLEVLADCDLVVEAIVENLAIKQALFQSLEKLLHADAILATNTSSLSVTAVASACERPERVVGWHFFNPVPLMRIAEVVLGERTAPGVADRLMQLTAAMGHHAVQATDLPGFIVNHAGRAFIPEGLRLLSEGVADAAEIDRVMRDVAGFRMGPLELLDLVGLDVAQQVMESLYHQYYEEPRFRITPLVARKVAAGQLGRKRSEGFYRYVDGKIQYPESPTPTVLGGVNVPVWVSPADAELAARVRSRLAEVPGVEWELGERPSHAALIVVTPVGEDTTTTCVAQGLDAARTVAVDALFSLARRATLMAAPGLLTPMRDAATALFQGSGVSVSWLRDSPGFVAQRIVAQIVNIGADMAQHRVATPADIDAAVTLALGYPQGPFGLARTLGEQRVLQISEALWRAYADPRYRASIWLRRRAQLSLPLDTLD
jgi:3-hydroxybutyryl-CoA dehydrogenase